MQRHRVLLQVLVGLVLASLAYGQSVEQLWKHVYNSERLIVKRMHKSVTGITMDATAGRNKDGCRHEADGDGHCWLKLDPGQEDLLSEGNMKHQDGNLVVEPICVYRVTQEDALSACKDFKQKLLMPPIGSHVRITGSYVDDHHHGHMEIHPVSEIEVLK